MKVRYYADAESRSWHEQTIRLLRTIHDKHGLPVEIDRIDERHSSITGFPGKVKYPTPEEVYERDLKHNRDLTERIDQRPSNAFKSYGDLDIAGNIALVDDEETVQWASTLPGYADGYGPDGGPYASLDFLKEFSRSPSNRVCVECGQLLNGNESFCPNCGCELS